MLCTGDGLGIGTVGKDIRSFIDTRRAGPGKREISIISYVMEFYVFFFTCHFCVIPIFSIY